MGRVFASADWHGNGEVAEKVFEWLKPDDILYFLGDAVDRGPDGVKIFDKLVHRPNTYYICGNHEEMMAGGISFLATLNSSEYSLQYENWLMNGGTKTLDSLVTMPDDQTIFYRNKILSMPDELVYWSPKGHAVILEHAGYTPGLKRISHDPKWDRTHFCDRWIESNKNLYLVHGHTPVQYLRFEFGYNGQPVITKDELKLRKEWVKSCINDTPFNWTPSIIRYCEGHKFDIDMGTAFSDRIVLLDLDTFEEIYFDKEERG